MYEKLFRFGSFWFVEGKGHNFGKLGLTDTLDELPVFLFSEVPYPEPPEGCPVEEEDAWLDKAMIFCRQLQEMPEDIHRFYRLVKTCEELGYRSDKQGKVIFWLFSELGKRYENHLAKAA